MTPAQSQRGSGRWIGIGMGVLALVCIAIAADGVYDMARGFATAAPLIVIATGAAIALPTTVILLSFAVMLVVPARERRRDERLFLAALVSLPLLFVAPMVLRWSVGAVLQDRGYQRCDTTPGRARLSQVWAAPRAACPSPYAG